MVDLLAHLPPDETLTLSELDAVEAARAGLVVAYDLREIEGAGAIVQTIRAKLEAGVIVTLLDSADVMPPFAIAPTSGAYVVTDEGGAQGSFADPIAALKHGLTMWGGYRRG